MDADLVCSVTSWKQPFFCRTAEAPLGGRMLSPSSLNVWQLHDGAIRTVVPHSVRMAIWTPDGKGLTALISPPVVDPRTVYNDNARIDIVNEQTGDLVTNILTGPWVECQLGMSWSPDGRYLAYGGFGFHQGCLDSSKLGLFTWEAARDTTVRLCSCSTVAPRWLPDGRVLAEVTGIDPPPANISLVGYQPDGSGQRVLAHSIPNSFPFPEPAFQLGQKEIMYATSSCEGAAAWVIEPGSADPRNLTSPTFFAIYPHLSLDGRAVAFSGVGSKGAYLALASTDHPHTTTPLIAAAGLQPLDFSPDSGSIAFAVTAQQRLPCDNT